MTFFNKKEYRNRLFYKKAEIKKILYKSLLANAFLNKNFKIYWFKIFIRFNKKQSISFYRNFCLVNNWARSVFRKFKMSRHQAKFFASFGLISGLRKASF